VLGSPQVAEDSDERAKDGGEIESDFPTGVGAVVDAPSASGAHRIWVRVILALATVLAILSIMRGS
jgi:hypothetical protein